MEKPGKWEDYLHLLEFGYNNNFQVSTGMNPFEILYGHKCNTPISWSSPVDRLMLGPNVIADFTTPSELHFVWPSSVLLQTP